MIAVLAVTFAMLASICEVVNFFRVGGIISILGYGKAVYQSSVGSLTLTLPSYEIALLAFSLIALAHAFSRNKLGSSRPLSKYVLLFILTISPLFVITVVLGKRGPLVGWLLVILVGVTYFRPTRRLSGRVMLILLIFYIGSSFIFANRWLITNTVLTGDWSGLFSQAFRFERVVKFLNPGANEFGSAFGNFSEYAKSGDSVSMYGVTYVIAPIGAIPSFLYPGEKPQQIGYEFRDKFFPSEALRARIAGTAFSSILEAYMNFGVLGVFGVYFLVGIVLAFIERARLIWQSPNFALFYLLMLPLAQKFHRSSFGSVVSTIFWATVLIIVFRLCYMVFVCIVKGIHNNKSCFPSRDQTGYDTV
ncbi:O-antigen polysaccharide polymerase Wzy [bacterium]|nr:O-antigen polysaccharide polymerase Wzy [bacterium]